MEKHQMLQTRRTVWDEDCAGDHNPTFVWWILMAAYSLLAIHCAAFLLSLQTPRKSDGKIGDKFSCTLSGMVLVLTFWRLATSMACYMYRSESRGCNCVCSIMYVLGEGFFCWVVLLFFKWILESIGFMKKSIRWFTLMAIAVQCLLIVGEVIACQQASDIGDLQAFASRLSMASILMVILIHMFGKGKENRNKFQTMILELTSSAKPTVVQHLVSPRSSCESQKTEVLERLVHGLNNDISTVFSIGSLLFAAMVFSTFGSLLVLLHPGFTGDFVDSYTTRACISLVLEFFFYTVFYIFFRDPENPEGFTHST